MVYENIPETYHPDQWQQVERYPSSEIMSNLRSIKPTTIKSEYVPTYFGPNPHQFILTYYSEDNIEEIQRMIVLIVKQNGFLISKQPISELLIYMYQIWESEFGGIPNDWLSELHRLDGCVIEDCVDNILRNIKGYLRNIALDVDRPVLAPSLPNPQWSTNKGTNPTKGFSEVNGILS